MAHELYGERFLGRREPAWHGLGQTFDQALAIGVREAVELAQCDYKVYKVPMTANVGEIDGLSAPIVLGNQVALMREPTHDDPIWQFFGTATDDYGLLQNTDIADAVEVLNEVWPIETVGALKNGRTFFLVLDAGSDDVAGEEIKKYFLVTDTKDGGTSAKIAFTPIRVVCQNTLTAGLRVATNSASIPHNSNVVSELEWRVNLLKQLSEAQVATMQSFRLMAETQITEDMARLVFESAYPYPSKPKKVSLLEELGQDIDNLPEYDEIIASLQDVNSQYQYFIDRADLFRGAVEDNYAVLNDKHPETAGTAWLAWQAVTEAEDWRRGPSTAGKIEASLLFGARAQAKRRAYNTALDFVSK
jgi:phage/plasmid-like protein (TIGR03299 family)